jgi:RNA polymerase sigma-70 factor (ECF subfamily)
MTAPCRPFEPSGGRRDEVPGGTDSGGGRPAARARGPGGASPAPDGRVGARPPRKRQRGAGRPTPYPRAFPGQGFGIGRSRAPPRRCGPPTPVGRSPRVDGVELSDEELCRRAAARAPGAFDMLVERYQQRAYRIAWSVLRHAEDARDCSQEAFVRLHESAGSFAGHARFSTWFYRILVNCCLDHRRRAQGWRRLMRRPVADRQRPPEDQFPEELSAPADDPLDSIEAERRARRVWDAVGDLSPQQRAVVMLQCREGLTTGEIAAVLQLSEATVRVHLHRALRALRKRLRSAT